MLIIENNDIRYWIEDGILYSEYKKETAIVLEKCKEIIALRHEISNGKKQYWLYDLRKATSMPADSRDYAEAHGQDLLYGCAVIVNSHITMFIYNIFVKTKTARVPLKVFTDKNKAFEWLKGIKRKVERN